jgi:saccharopine dehydrogenase-like NADP-dependent oxidoreductase
MGFDFVVFGSTGMQGRIVTRDLAENGYSILLTGRDKPRVNHLLKRFKKTAFEYLDLNDIDRAAEIVKNSGAKIVVNCAEGDMNLNALNACLAAGAHSIDLGSDIPMTKDQLKKNRELKQKNLIHITGCGSVPGIGNVMLNYASRKFDRIDDVEVGFAWDSNIKEFYVPFSMPSIFEEFTAPAPIVSNNKIVKLRPMDSIIKCYHKAVGREKQFNVGHHPETLTFYNFCKDKGIKNVKFFAGFPDHSFQIINDLIKLGFASEEERDFNGVKIAPVDYVTNVLKDLKMPEGYTETENLWVELSAKGKKILMECIVPPLKGWEEAGCNIDTGMPASIMAQMIKKGVITKPGSYAPEDIVPPEELFAELRKREMLVYENGRVIN